MVFRQFTLILVVQHMESEHDKSTKLDRDPSSIPRTMAGLRRLVQENDFGYYGWIPNVGRWPT